MIRVNVGELQPRFIPTKGAMEKEDWTLKKGDRIELAVSAENLVVDYHPVNAPGWHRIIKGQLAQPLIVGYEWAVIRTDNGKEEAFPVRPLARLKVAALPIGIPALFLVGEAGKILDATFVNEELAHRQVQEWKRSVPESCRSTTRGDAGHPAGLDGDGSHERRTRTSYGSPAFCRGKARQPAEREVGDPALG